MDHFSDSWTFWSYALRRGSLRVLVCLCVLLSELSDETSVQGFRKSDEREIPLAKEREHLDL